MAAPSLFSREDYPELAARPVRVSGKGLKLVGIERVLARSRKEWKDSVRAAISRLILYRTTITSDDVLALMESIYPAVKPVHPNAIGASMRSAACAGLIQPTGRSVNSRRPSAHARMIQVWQASP